MPSESSHLLATDHKAQIDSFSLVPDDILVMIFSSCYWDASQDSDAIARICTKVLLQVCRRWHDIVMGHAAMWSRLDLSRMSDAQAEKIFERSRGCKKRVTYTSNEQKVPVPPRILASLGENIECVAVLDFVLANPLPFISWLSNVTSSVTTLHTLSLGVVHPASSGATDATASLIGSALIAFLEKAPNIRHLAFVGLHVPWKAGLCRKLTTLRLSNCLKDADILCGHIFDLLRGSLSLEELEVSLDSGTSWTLAQDQQGIHGDDFDKVYLSSLRELRLSLPQRFLFHFLRGIHIPNDLRVLNIDIDDRLPRGGDHTLTSQIFSSHLLPRTILEGAQVVEAVATEHSDYIKFTGRHPGDEREFRVYLASKRTTRLVFGEIIKGIIMYHNVALSTVQSLQIIVSKTNIAPSHVWRFAAHLNSLVHLKITAHSKFYSQFLTALSVDPSKSSSIFPHLRTLQIITSDLRPLPQLCKSFLSETPNLENLYLAWDGTGVNGQRTWRVVEQGIRRVAQEIEMNHGAVKVSVLPPREVHS